MAQKTRKSLVLKEIQEACASEEKAAEFLEKHRWNGRAFCPRCGAEDVYAMRDRNCPELRERNRRWRCRGCKKMFSVRTGTVMEESRLPLKVWLHAYWRACASKKGVSALQIKRECQISYEAALFLMHRIRHGMKLDQESGPKLSGIVEVDEAYVGGKPRHSMKLRRKRRDPKARVSWSEKTPIMALVERGGQVRARQIERVTAGTLRGAVEDLVERGSRVHTDENRSYKALRKHYQHESVNHSRGEYVRGDVTTNTAEGFFAIFKRGVYGIWHSVSKHHLHYYLGEAEFRYNTRDVDDGERVLMALANSEGKRLSYHPQTI